MFSILTLGCGSAKPSLRHNPSCTVVEFRGNLFMIDCGEGAQLEMQRHHLKFSRLNHIFLTHLHGDHCFGLVGLVSSLALLGKEGNLHIYTFADGIEMFSRMFNYFCRELPFEIIFHEIKPERAVVYEDSALTISTVPLHHRLPTVGYIFREKQRLRHINRQMVDFHKVPVAQLRAIKEGKPFVKPDGTEIPAEVLTTAPTPPRSYAHIGDTAYLPDLAKEIGPVDLLYHETTYLDCDKGLARERGHSTALQAAMMARDCGAKKLLTGHYSSRYRNDSLFEEEAKTIFPATILNREGLRINLTK